MFKVPAGVDQEWDDAMLAAGQVSSCHYVQIAMLHFQRRSIFTDGSTTAAVDIIRHGSIWNEETAAFKAQSLSLNSMSIGDGTVITVSYAVRCSSGSQWSDVAVSRDVTVGGVDLPMGLDAAVRSMQVLELCDVCCSAEDAYAAEAPADGVPEGVDPQADVVFRYLVLSFMQSPVCIDI
jgi:hypothetical protein